MLTQHAGHAAIDRSRPVQLRIPFATRIGATRRRRQRIYRALNLTSPTPQIVQLHLPLKLPQYRLSDLSIGVLVTVTRVADQGAEMPPYPVLAQMLGAGHGRQAVAKAFDRLVNLGYCRVEFRRGFRRVLIVATGRLTGWGPFISGPIPYSRPVQPIPTTRPERMPSHDVVKTPCEAPLRSHKAATPAYQPPIVPPARTCQYPLDLEAKGEKVPFCGCRSLPGKSWCEEHAKVVFQPRRSANP